MKEEIEFINILVEKKKQEIETVLKWSKKGREEIEKLHSIRLALSEKMDKADELKNMARRILGEEEKPNISDGNMVFKSIEDKRDKEPESLHTETKYCSGCKQEKPISDFYKNASKNDGVQHHCKDCHDKQVKTYQIKNKKPKTMKKYCRKCGQEKPISSFSMNSTRTDGLQSYCKKCARIIATDYNKKHKQLKHKQLPKGWHIYKQFFDGKWRDTNVMKHLFQKQYPDTRQSVIDVYMARCKRYAEDNLNLTYWSDNKGGQWLFRISKTVPDIPISNGTKPDAIPVTASNTVDRKDKIHTNWYKFRLGTR